MKNIRIISAAAVAAISLASCTEENIGIPVPPDMLTMTFSAASPSEPSESPESPEYQGLPEKGASPLVKAVLGDDGESVLWSAGDRIAVSGAETAFVSAIEDGTVSASTSFTGQAPEAESYSAVYPFSALRYWSGTAATVELPSRQTASEGTFADGLCICVASTDTESRTFRFRHVLGFVKFTVAESSGAVTSVTLSSNGGEGLSGTFTVDCAEAAPAAEVTEGTGSVTLESDAAFAPGDYYVAMIPGTYAQGLTLTFTDSEGRTASRTVSTSLTLAAGSIRNIGIVANLDWTAAPAAGPQVIVWEGEHSLGNYDNNLELDFKSVTDGSILYVEYTGTDGGDGIQFKICDMNNNWEPLAGTGYYDGHPGEDAVRFDIEPSGIASIKSSGFAIQGRNATVTRVYFVHPADTGLREPVLDTDIMIFDFNPEGDGHNGSYDQSWDGLTEFRNEDGNGYVEVVYTAGSEKTTGWLFQCGSSHEVPGRPEVDDVGGYDLLMDIFVPEGWYDKGDVRLQFVIADNYYWYGENRFIPLVGNGTWQTLRLSTDVIDGPADFTTGNYGLAIDGGSTGVLPAGMKFDNIRFSLKD